MSPFSDFQAFLKVYGNFIGWCSDSLNLITVGHDIFARIIFSRIANFELFAHLFFAYGHQFLYNPLLSFLFACILFSRFSLKSWNLQKYDARENIVSYSNPNISFVNFSYFETLKTIARCSFFLNSSDIFKEQVYPIFSLFEKKKNPMIIFFQMKNTKSSIFSTF